MSVIHQVKCWPAYFQRVVSGEKPFEIRRDDRGYQRGDILLLAEWDPEGSPMGAGRYTGAEHRAEITWILTGGQFGLEPGYVAMGLRPLDTN